MKESRYITDNWFREFPLGNEEPGTKNVLDQNEFELGFYNGYTLTSIEYYINSFRYRGYIEPSPGRDAAFGCSYTLGFGVRHPWPELMDIANCGVNGASNDHIVRAAISYCETFKPENIYVLWTFPERRDHIEEDGGVHRYRNMSESRWKEELENPTWRTHHMMLGNTKANKYNKDKNKLLLEMYCSVNNVKLHQLDYNWLINDRGARDYDHPGETWHANTAAHFLLP